MFELIAITASRVRFADDPLFTQAVSPICKMRGKPNL
jgi:hypothetical protein